MHRASLPRPGPRLSDHALRLVLAATGLANVRNIGKAVTYPHAGQGPAPPPGPPQLLSPDRQYTYENGTEQGEVQPGSSTLNVTYVAQAALVFVQLARSLLFGWHVDQVFAVTVTVMDPTRSWNSASHIKEPARPGKTVANEAQVTAEPAQGTATDAGQNGVPLLHPDCWARISETRKSEINANPSARRRENHVRRVVEGMRLLLVQMRRSRSPIGARHAVCGANAAGLVV